MKRRIDGKMVDFNVRIGTFQARFWRKKLNWSRTGRRTCEVEPGENCGGAAVQHTRGEGQKRALEAYRKKCEKKTRGERIPPYTSAAKLIRPKMAVAECMWGRRSGKVR